MEAFFVIFYFTGIVGGCNGMAAWVFVVSVIFLHPFFFFFFCDFCLIYTDGEEEGNRRKMFASVLWWGASSMFSLYTLSVFFYLFYFFIFCRIAGLMMNKVLGSKSKSPLLQRCGGVFLKSNCI